MIDLNSTHFKDQLYGCWMGKNCGGTLGAPLEKIYGEEEPFDVWWYPELRDGGIPNDDLEMQLVWLKALEEVGPQLNAKHLAQYWLDHIGYNWDEYGFNKTNLRLGLLPPVSGHYNNWFIDCMGCPIRSELWACIAPGVPALAARYAYEDAICDHAGGESIYGEIFNATVESAAFVVSDRTELINIGLSYIPSDSKTAQAIRAACQAHQENLTWQEARQRVLAATPHYNAQYSPINLGFQVVGWLYGEDFGDAICKAVNCGYDTDCTGATLGSYLGIIAGRHGLPAKWTSPLGDNISTNESWGGLRNTSTGPNPVPTDLNELIDRIIIQAKRVLAAHDLLDGSIVRVNPNNLYANESIKELWHASPHQITYPGDALDVTIDYLTTPAIIPNQPKPLNIHLRNNRTDTLNISWHLQLPSSWSATPTSSQLEIPPHTTTTLNLSVTAPDPTHVSNTNTLFFTYNITGRPAQPSTPIVLPGARHFLASPLYPAHAQDIHTLFTQEIEPAHLIPSVTWQDLYATEYALPLQNFFTETGILYLRSFLWNPGSERELWMGIDCTGSAKMWVNNQLALQYTGDGRRRPNYGGNKTRYTTVQLQPGWNEVLLNLAHTNPNTPFEAHFLYSDPKNQHAGITDIEHTRLP